MLNGITYIAWLRTDRFIVSVRECGLCCGSYRGFEGLPGIPQPVPPVNRGQTYRPKSTRPAEPKGDNVNIELHHYFF
jgi:hypothetical protein